MNQEEITLALRMLAMGRANHPATLVLIDALAVVLASPEERLAMTVQDAPMAVVDAPADVPTTAKRRGRPPKAK